MSQIPAAAADSSLIEPKHDDNNNTTTSTSTDEQVNLILPTTGKVFYEQKDELRFCQPHLMPLKSFTLAKLEKMQIEAHKRMQESRNTVN